MSMRTSLLLTAMIVINLLPGAAAQAAPTSPVDLALDEIVVGTPVVGQTIVVTAVVFNAGSQDVTASVTFGWNSESRPLAGNLPVVGPQNVPARGRAEFNFTSWIPDPGQAGEGWIYARVNPTAGSDSTTYDIVRSAKVFVERYDVELELLGGGGAATSRRVPEPGTEGHFQALAFPFRVANRGNVRDVVNVTTRNETLPDNWTINASNRFFALEPGESLQGFAYLEPPTNATNHTIAQLATVFALSEGYRARLPPEQREDPASQVTASQPTPQVQPRDEVETNYSVRVTADAGPVFVEAGKVGPVALTIRNDGAVQDIYNVTASVTGNASARVADRDVDPNATMVALAPGETRRLTFNVTVDANATPQDVANLTLRVESMNWKAASATRAVTVRPSTIDLAVDRVEAQPAAYRGAPSRLVVSGRNLADRGAASVPLSVRVFSAGAWVNASSAPANFTTRGLDAWSASVPFDTTALAGNYLVEARADPAGIFPEANRSNNVLVSQVFVHRVDLRLIAPDALTVHPGERVSLSQGGPGFYVTNLGNHEEDVELRLVSASGWLNVSATQRVGVGQTLAVPVFFDVPETGLALEDVVVATALVPAEGRTRASANATLQIKDDSPPVIVVDVPAGLRVGDAADLRASIRDATNVSSATANVTLPDGSWQSVALGLADDGSYHGTFRPLVAGRFSLVVDAADGASPPNANRTAPVSFDVLPPGGPPEISFEGVASGDAIGPGTPLKVRVSGNPLQRLNHSVDGGPAKVLEAPFVVSTAEWTAGSHTVRVDALDAYGQAATATLRLVKDLTPPALGNVEVARISDRQVEVSVRATDGATSGFVLVQSTGLRAPLSRGNPMTAVVDAAPGDVLTVTVSDAVGNVAAQDVTLQSRFNLPGPVPLLLISSLAMAAALRARRKP